MKALLLCLMLGVIPSWAGGRVAPSVRLYTQFQKEPPEEVMASLQVELRAILEPLGLGFEWRDLELSRGNEVSTELAVIHFQGSCDLQGLTPVMIHPGPLGWTHLSNGEVLPFTDISCDRIRLFIQHDLVRLPERERESAYGKAVARVLAHELYHIFAKTTKHGSWGIAKPAYTVDELLCPQFQFEKRESDVLRAHYQEMSGFANDAGQ